MDRLEMLKKEKAQIEARLKEINAELARIKRENPQNKKRNIAIYEMRESGETYRTIASIFCISVGGVQSICKRIEKKNKRDAKFPDFSNISQALYHILINSNVSTKAEIIDCLNDKNGFAIRQSDFGDARHHEFDDFVGMSTIITNRISFKDRHGYEHKYYVLKPKEAQNG